MPTTVLGAVLALAVGFQPPAPASAPPVAQTPQAAGGAIRFGSKEPKARPAGTIRVATYNVENLFDAKDDPALKDDKDDVDMTKPEEQRRAIAAAIRRVDADVLAVEEVESYDALVEFRDQFLSELGYTHVVSLDSGDTRGIECAVLSRFPLSDPKVWPELPLGGVHPEKWGNSANFEAGKPIVFRRSPLRVTVTVPPSPERTGAKPYVLTLFVVHHKSGGPGGYWREREATKTVELIREVQQADPGRNIVVLGDFNSRPDEKPAQTYAAAGFVDAFGAARPKHSKLEPALITHASGRPIDLVYLSPSVAKELVPGSPFVLGTPVLPEGADFRRVAPPPGYGSDHFPVAFDLVPVDG